jgi:hypothetical protein
VTLTLMCRAIRGAFAGLFTGVPSRAGAGGHGYGYGYGYGRCSPGW